MLKNHPTVFFLLAICFAPQMGGLLGQTFVQNTDPNNPVNTINLRGLYRGCAWADLDNDGDPDLSLEGWALRNDGQGAFSIIQSFGAGPLGGPAEYLGGVSWSDFDNDGDLDCLYSATTQQAGVPTGRTIIYENDGTGVFNEKMIDAGGAALPTWSAAWGDYNHDGLTDAIGSVAFGFAGLAMPAFFYKGNPDGSFTKIDTFQFTQNTAPYTVAYWSDYDRDGDSDLFLAAGPGGSPGPDFHYKNLLAETGTAGLQRITDQPFATQQQDGQCYNFIDHDLDGDLDIYLTNYSGAPNRFYENQGGTYAAITGSPLIFNGPTLGNCWGDFDNDGDQDVLLTSDNLNETGYFENQNGVFIKLNNPFSGFAPSNVSGLTIGDYDNDGDLDFFANGGVASTTGARGLFRNDLSNANHWAHITCKGDPSNRAALGAVIYLSVNIGGEQVWLQREVSAQNTFMGHNDLRLHFGLGNATIIDTLRIVWPSGNVDGYTNVPVDEFYTANEGSDLNGLTPATERPKMVAMLDVQPNPVGASGTKINNVFYGEMDSLTVQVFSATGQLLRQFSQENTSNWVGLETGDLPSGTYLIRLTAGEKFAVGKFVKE